MLTFFTIFELSGQPEDMLSKVCKVDTPFYLKHHGEQQYKTEDITQSYLMSLMKLKVLCLT